MGYGDEVYIPDELKGNQAGRYFSLKVGGPTLDRLEEMVEKHLLNLRRVPSIFSAYTTLITSRMRG